MSNITIEQHPRTPRIFFVYGLDKNNEDDYLGRIIVSPDMETYFYPKAELSMSELKGVLSHIEENDDGN